MSMARLSRRSFRSSANNASLSGFIDRDEPKKVVTPIIAEKWNLLFLSQAKVKVELNYVNGDPTGNFPRYECFVNLASCRLRKSSIPYRVKAGLSACLRSLSAHRVATCAVSGAIRPIHHGRRRGKSGVSKKS